VRGTLTAAQFHSITLLDTDYKLHTKMFVARLLDVIPDDRDSRVVRVVGNGEGAKYKRNKGEEDSSDGVHLDRRAAVNMISRIVEDDVVVAVVDSGEKRQKMMEKVMEKELE
jgi:hypothetical protein